jgi:proteasome lid subunit RPN8/RPN11
MEGARVSDEDRSEMGPIDYLIVEWPGRQPTGEAVPHLIDLVDRGLIRPPRRRRLRPPRRPPVSPR